KNVYDLTKKNQDWYDHTFALLDALMAAGISPHLKFLDIYQDQNWDSGTNKSCKYKPFRHNTFGQVITGQQLYDSWSSGAGGHTLYYWMSWTFGPQSKWIPATYQLLPPFGKPIGDWVNAVIAGCKVLRAKYPTIPILYAYANECLSTTDGQGHYIHGGKN